VRLDDTLAALSDPTRRALVERVAHGPRRAGDLARGFRMSRPAVSKHLRVLREAGLVVAERRGREQVYRLSPPGIQEVRDYLDRISAFWDVALESFKRYAEGGEA
jgi:DNA-binding transcriptional ArsR family regulator